jgi:hypothetical protein
MAKNLLYFEAIDATCPPRTSPHRDGQFIRQQPIPRRVRAPPSGLAF